MAALQELAKHLRPGQVYRRAQLKKWSKAVDRHLKQLQDQKKLKKLSGGVYYCPKNSSFGTVPPEEHKQIEAFLKDNRFLMKNPSVYNTLCLGTTQLYNETHVYNHKRHGTFKLGNKTYKFMVKHHFPRKLSNEFLLVDLVDNLDMLTEDTDKVLKNVRKKALSMDKRLLQQAVKQYGGRKSKAFFSFDDKG